jgi:hypothetical protein
MIVVRPRVGQRSWASGPTVSLAGTTGTASPHVRYVRVVADEARIAELLQEAAEAHHVVYRIVDGDDPDWASWYADWLLELSELPELLNTKPVRSHLVHALVELDREHDESASSERWQDAYARGLVERFAA